MGRFKVNDTRRVQVYQIGERADWRRDDLGHCMWGWGRRDDIVMDMRLAMQSEERLPRSCEEALFCRCRFEESTHRVLNQVTPKQ